MEQESNAEAYLQNKIKSRKFLFSVGIALSAAGLVINGSIDAATYAQVTNVTILGYLTGNVAQSVMKK